MPLGWQTWSNLDTIETLSYCYIIWVWLVVDIKALSFYFNSKINLLSRFIYEINFKHSLYQSSWEWSRTCTLYYFWSLESKTYIYSLINLGRYLHNTITLAARPSLTSGAHVTNDVYPIVACPLRLHWSQINHWI
jgi:hypothetical protein